MGKYENEVGQMEQRMDRFVQRINNYLLSEKIFLKNRTYLKVANFIFQQKMCYLANIFLLVIYIYIEFINLFLTQKYNVFVSKTFQSYANLCDAVSFCDSSPISMQFVFRFIGTLSLVWYFMFVIFCTVTYHGIPKLYPQSSQIVINLFF